MNTRRNFFSWLGATMAALIWPKDVNAAHVDSIGCAVGEPNDLIAMASLQANPPRLTFADLMDGQHSLEEVAQVFDDCKHLLRAIYEKQHDEARYHVRKSLTEADAVDPFYPLCAEHAGFCASHIFWPKLKASAAQELYTPVRDESVQRESYEPYERLPEWAAWESMALKTHMKIGFELLGMPYYSDPERTINVMQSNQFAEMGEAEAAPLRRLTATWARIKSILAQQKIV